MAEVLRLATTDQGEVYDLLSEVYQLHRGGFEPKTAGPADEWITETISLVGSGSPSELVAAEARIHEFAERARRYGEDPLEVLGTWLEWNLAGESPKRAFLSEARFALAQPKGFGGAFLETGASGFLAYTRSPYWENVAAESVSATGLSANGGKWTLTGEAAYAGNFPGRIAVGSFDIGLPYMGQLWAGIRRVRLGVSDFDPVWDLKDGTNGTDTSSQTDATAVSGTAKECTFSTDATERMRVRISLPQGAPGADSTHYVGRYLLLGRFRCEGGGTNTTVWIRTRCGSGPNPPFVGERVYFQWTAYALAELGFVQIPYTYYRSGQIAQFDLDDTVIELWVERLSGTGSFWLDELIFIPWDHSFKAESPFDQVELVTTLEDPGGAVWADATEYAYDAQLRYSPNRWQMPTDPGCLVLAAEKDGIHYASATVDVGLTYHPRWRMYRTT